MASTRMKLGLALSALALLAAPPALAQEQSTIRTPGDHPDYSLEIEPHAAVGLSSRFDGVGVGGRFSIPVIRNGFIPSINDSVAIGVGIDWAHREGCFGFAGCGGADAFWIPVVAQWNFYLSPRWSTFVEPGLALGHTIYTNTCEGRDAAGNSVLTACSGSETYLDPALFIGARYRASDQLALTMRIGYPYLSVGGSFM